MDIAYDIVLWIHFASLAAGVGGGAVLGPIAGAFAKAGAEGKQTLAPLRMQVVNMVTAALVVLLISGPILLWMKYDGVTGLSWWFWAKMVLVLVLVVTHVMARLAMRRAAAGDAAAGAQVARLGIIAGPTSFLIILCAAFAFS